jgi:hypothetical protein
MAEKRSIPAALGIFIGPAVAYLSYLIFNSGLSEFAQIACFALFLMAGHDLAKSSISLSGILILLLLPAIPIAMYLSQASVPADHQLSPVVIISLWVASVLLGALIAGRAPRAENSVPHVTRLAICATGLFIVIAATFIF